MAITAAMVKELREISGAGMMDCKKALNETNGDMEAAMEYLRKNGQAKAEKKAGRIAAEGLCRIAVKDDTTAAVVEVNSETDFVAKNETFQEFVASVAQQAVDSEAADVDAFLAEAWNADPSKTVKEALVEKIATIGENLNIRRFQKVVAEHGCVVTYTHGGGRIGVIVEADTDVVNDAIKECLTNVAMQVAAMNPVAVRPDEVPQHVLDQELEIAKDKARQAGKPENLLDRIAQGALQKYFKENTLLQQEFIRDAKMNIEQYLHTANKELTVVAFKRFTLNAD